MHATRSALRGSPFRSLSRSTLALHAQAKRWQRCRAEQRVRVRGPVAESDLRDIGRRGAELVHAAEDFRRAGGTDERNLIHLDEIETDLAADDEATVKSPIVGGTSQ